MRNSVVVQRGTLEVVEIVNGYALYGKGIYLESTAGKPDEIYPDVYLGHLGDTAMPYGYDPNEDHDLPEAYGFTLV